MPWLLDGNNLVGGRNREAARRAALQLARNERLRIVLYFDGAPPEGSPGVERLGAVEVVYVPNVDEAVVQRLRHGGSGWKVVTDDRELARRVRATGAEVTGSRSFWHRLEGAEPAKQASRVSNVDEELRYFADANNRMDDPRSRSQRRRRR